MKASQIENGVRVVKGLATALPGSRAPWTGEIVSDPIRESNKIYVMVQWDNQSKPRREHIASVRARREG